MDRKFKALPKLFSWLIQLSMRFVTLFWNQNFSIFFGWKIAFRISTPEHFFGKHYVYQFNQIYTAIHMLPIEKKCEHASNVISSLCTASDLFNIAIKTTKNLLKDQKTIFIAWKSFVVMNYIATGLFFHVVDAFIDSDFMISIKDKSRISFKKA